MGGCLDGRGIAIGHLQIGIVLTFPFGHLRELSSHRILHDSRLSFRLCFRLHGIVDECIACSQYGIFPRIGGYYLAIATLTAYYPKDECHQRNNHPLLDRGVIP